MPNYNFRNNETGEEWEEFFTMGGKDTFLEQNPEIVQLPSLFSMSASGTGDRIKNDAGWKENLSRIAEAHPTSPLADRYGKKATKDIKTKQVVEKFSVVKSLQAIKDSNVVVLLIDAREGIVEQDLHLLGYVVDSGRALVVAINKWDGMEAEEKELIKSEIRRRLRFIDFAAIHFISARHGSGVGKIYESIHVAFESARNQLSTSKLTQILQGAVKDHAPPVINGRRIKLRYAHAGGKNPPRIIIHGKQIDKIPRHYNRYLEKTFRNALKLQGTPMRIEMRGEGNPFTKEEENLPQRKIARKRQIKNNKRYLKR